ncbi:MULTISPECIES: DUF4044 domain-containing protein [Loigolactobacillus]|nr:MULTISPECIES: DUF4044 domain-containing protein [Loigolactobacillus]MDA5387159.1 DUF4044 domain-containing protein [Loigolactobacillus backii]MDA5389618.1 DUF4044 domain-containing protein [Loigolactobacillus backii]PIO83683.1 hypothetical protein BSQ39_08940 [Loigolactobacillus backii]PIO87514.1 hypothetical protein B8A32_10380 [Loigolactobacillus backii]
MKKETSTFTKLTKVIIWIMLFATVGGVVLGAVGSLGLL